MPLVLQKQTLRNLVFHLTDKIPIDDFKEDVNEGGMWKLGSIVLSSAEYGFAETINSLVEDIIELKERITKLELK